MVRRFKAWEAGEAALMLAAGLVAGYMLSVRWL